MHTLYKSTYEAWKIQQILVSHAVVFSQFICTISSNNVSTILIYKKYQQKQKEYVYF